jgi:hypothetical protein
MIERARTWAEIARHAPSGDNCQPWQVELGAQGERLTLTLALDAATRSAPSLFDCAFAASFLSLGAFAQNFILLAESEGWTLADLHENSGRFILTFAPAVEKPTGPSPDETAALIRRRTTNRLPYKREPLDEDTRRCLARIAAESAGGPALRDFSGATKSRLAGVFYALDQVRYRNRRLYLEFLDKLRFGDEALRSADGLRDSTLGVPPPALWFLRLLRALRNVSVVRAFFFLGLEKAMAFSGALVPVRKSASVCVLTASDDSPLGWFGLGRCFQELWLEVTRRGLAMQPLGTTLMIYRLEREQRLGEPSSFSPADGDCLRTLAGRFSTEFGLDLGQPGLAFRVGRGPMIENRSLRRPLNAPGGPAGKPA